MLNVCRLTMKRVEDQQSLPHKFLIISRGTATSESTKTILFPIQILKICKKMPHVKYFLPALNLRLCIIRNVFSSYVSFVKVDEVTAQCC